MSGTYVSQNGTGEFEIRPFQLESICQANDGHSHHYDHWMRINRGSVEITVREPSKWQLDSNLLDEQVEGSTEVLGAVIEVITVSANNVPTIECVRYNGEIQLFHAFVAKELWHRVKCLEDNTQYDCCFLHRDFDTGEAIQTYNGNPEAST